MHIKLMRKTFFWYIKIVAGNGETLLTSETYFTKSNAKRAAEKLSKKLGMAVK